MMFTYIIMGFLFFYNIAILASISKDIKLIQERIRKLEKRGDDGKER